MPNFLSKILSFGADKDLKAYQRIVEKINALEPTMQEMSDEELQAQTEKFKARYAEGESLDDLLPEAFATVREASVRTIGQRHFDVQLIGGIALHKGTIAEMKTGEGKTLVSTLAGYLNALSGKGVHIVTVNDYLAKRDSEWMGTIYKFLGISVGLLQNGMRLSLKKPAYEADITYGTNSEFGFDYLRDNMVTRPEMRVQRGHHYAIVDEVDSILIDEARTPLIISGAGTKSAGTYKDFAKAVRGLTPDVDFEMDEAKHTIATTEIGLEKVERALNIDDIYNDETGQLVNHLQQALKAEYMFHRDQQYVVIDGEVKIVDEFTGRIMEGRRYSEGLHQAIEAKENVQVREENQTLATITLQNYFLMYDKLSGMTGTAMTEDAEFREVYHVPVQVIPPNRPVKREDLDDLVYRTIDAKFEAVVRDVEERHQNGQPVLVGTVSIDNSERISRILSKRGIKHNVLNAKFHEREAQIIAQAGREGAVTIATNMAGRGTDIKLDEESVKKGGLKIIGTERHESRRIDNQLRGRSGRQGDPGESRFYISLEDDLMRLFASERLINIFNALGVPENEQIEHKMLTRAIEKAQMKIESNNYGIRENLLKYDEVNNEQREVIYEERNKVLEGDNMRDTILRMVNDVIEHSVNMAISDEVPSSEWNMTELHELLLPIIPLTPADYDNTQDMKKDELIHKLKEEAIKLYEAKEAEFPDAEKIRELERVVLLKAIDNKWMNHIDDMEQLRQGIGLQALGQRDPLVEYKMAAYDMFDEMTRGISEDTVRILYHVKVEQKVEREPAAKVTGTNKDDSTVKKPIRIEAKVYPNDPCPCGSGKKYKQCHGRKGMTL